MTLGHRERLACSRPGACHTGAVTHRSRAAPGEARAHARVNVALAKYWGKADPRRNVPAVPSISMTVDGLGTETLVSLRPGAHRVEAWLDGRKLRGRELERVERTIRRITESAGLGPIGAHVRSHNTVPTAAGLASSASGFAALVAATAAAAGLRWGPRRLSGLAREASASAARSFFGGFVELPAGRPGAAPPTARPLLPSSHWPDLRLLVALTERGPKKVGSTDGMERTRRTSPYYTAWLREAPRLARRIRAALRARDLRALGEATERSTMAYLACALAADPPLRYWAPSTLSALRTVERLRERGLEAWATTDAGPHVKVLCLEPHTRRIARALRRTEGVEAVLVCRPGPGVHVEPLG